MGCSYVGREHLLLQAIQWHHLAFPEDSYDTPTESMRYALELVGGHFPGPSELTVTDGASEMLGECDPLDLDGVKEWLNLHAEQDAAVSRLLRSMARDSNDAAVTAAEPKHQAVDRRPNAPSN